MDDTLSKVARQLGKCQALLWSARPLLDAVAEKPDGHLWERLQVHVPGDSPQRARRLLEFLDEEFRRLMGRKEGPR